MSHAVFSADGGQRAFVITDNEQKLLSISWTVCAKYRPGKQKSIRNQITCHFIKLD